MGMRMIGDQKIERMAAYLWATAKKMKTADKEQILDAWKSAEGGVTERERWRRVARDAVRAERWSRLW